MRLGETDLRAADIDAALWVAADVAWPTGACACRLTTLDGHEVAYRFRPAADSHPAMILKSD